MNFRKNSVLIIGCAIAGVLLVAAVVFLVKNRAEYQANTEALTASKNRLNELNTRDPFPSQENVDLSRENLNFLKQKFETVHESLVHDQLQAETIEPARFAPLLEQAARRVFVKAIDAGVTISPALGLGFRLYAEGKLPPNNPATMDRLVLQVKAAEDLCSLIIDSKVQSIDNILREEFEVSPDAGAEQAPEMRERGRAAAVRTPQGGPVVPMIGGIPVAPSNSLYTTERFIISMTGSESSIWGVLNRLADRKVVYVLVDATLENSKLDLGKPVDIKAKFTAMNAASRASLPGGAAAPVTQVSAASLESFSRDDRIVGGREPVKAKIVVDMYRYHQTKAAEVQP